MFVKKLVEKAAKKPGGNFDGLKSSEVDARVVFHYGIPSGCNMFAYDSIQKILAISTKDGRIKLLGKDNTQALLESNEISPSKFLQFMENRGILLNVTSKNHLEVWDIDKKLLSHVHVFKEEITSFTVLQHSLFIYVGDSYGNISVLKLDEEPFHIVQMKYTIPLSASHGNVTEVSGDNAVLHILPQPTAESKRVLIIFRDGLISLWDIRESKSIFTTGGSMLQSLYHEAKQVTSACWACPFGSKVVVGYSNGEIFIWSIPSTANSSTEASDRGSQNAPICKLNLGYKMEKNPIASLKWAYADGKASRLYVTGASNSVSVNLLQVILLNEQTESRTIKLGLHLPETCIDMEIISSSDQSKHKQDFLLLLGKSGHVYAYDDCLIEKYLLQCQSRSPPSLPKEIMLKMPFTDSSITIAKFITDNQCMISPADEDVMGRNIPPLLPSETKQKDGSSARFSGFSKVKNLYITGHSDGAINLWDASFPFLIPVLSLKQQSEDDFSLSGIALTALYFDGKSQLLVSGDQSGMVRIFKFKPEPYATEGSFMSLPGSIKRGNNHIIHSVKLIKINGSVLSINISSSSRNLAVGSDQGYVSVIDIEGATLLYQNHIASEICTGIISLQFQTCSLHGFEKNVLVVGTKDSSVLALDSDTGNLLSTSRVHPKKPSKALFMQTLDGQDANGPDLSKRNSLEDATPKQLVLLCSEKAVYVYSLTHVIQGVKKVHYKKKYQTSSCCWASTFYSSSDVGLILLFTSGKIEIRSLPELSLLKETSIRGFTNSTSNPNSLSDISICTSREGELVMVNGDQEIIVISVLFQKEKFRLLDTVSHIYRKDLMLAQEGLVSGPIVQKERKKGIFSSVIKDITGSKAKPLPEVETEDPRESIKELHTIFSTANFPSDTENRDEDDIHLDIDDIDLEEPRERPKEQNMLTALNKQKLASIQALKGFTGKLKQMKVKNQKSSTKEEQQDEKAGAVDQIKKKYGFSLSGESSAAKMAESKLHENLRKLQGINSKATEMQDTAKSFSSMAEQVLRTEQHKRGS
ncbi:isoform 2 of syntaxin-binding protein 5 [Fagus crenata]